jgi:hypothetical protein
MALKLPSKTVPTELPATMSNESDAIGAGRGTGKKPAERLETEEQRSTGTLKMEWRFRYTPPAGPAGPSREIVELINVDNGLINQKRINSKCAEIPCLQ